MPNIREQARLRRSFDAADFRALHAASGRSQLRHQVRRAGRQPRHSRASRRTVSRRQRGHHHVGLAGGGELRRDRGQRRRQPICSRRAAQARAGGRTAMSLAPDLRRHSASAAVPAAGRNRRAGSAERIVCRKTFAAEEAFYAGHYPGFPITPGVLLCEAAMQAGAVLLSQYWSSRTGPVCPWPRA